MLRVENVHLFYGASHILRGVNIRAEKGQVTCILGRNGVGKTSLMRAILGLKSVGDGSILWEDNDMTQLYPHQRARLGLANVPQGREIFPRLTVEENLRTGFAPLPKALRTIPEHVFQLFPALKNMLPRRGGDLSGGQQQQLTIARALVTRPRLLILDEPTEGIQPSIIKEIKNVIERLASRGDMAILLVEQYFEFARDLADQFYVLNRGETVMEGQRGEMDETDVRRHLTV
jgi:urea transport system ATP-binding protein